MAEPFFSGQNRVVVDWDGTCVPQQYPGQPQEWLPGAVSALRRFLEAGLDVQVSSTRIASRDVDETTSLPRSSREREVRYIRRMLDEAGLQDVGIWRKPWKPGAQYYVDDKGVRFDGNWEAVVDVVLG